MPKNTQRPYLFIFAHPNDETVACAGTIKALTEHGERVIIISITDGAAGQVHEQATQQFEKHGSVSELRRAELKQVAAYLQVERLHILDFADGCITNEIVWGKLKNACIDLIDKYQPQCVVTFDHSGWYFHLDHVGVSIAVTLAVQEAKYPPDIFFLSHFRVKKTKWKYIYSDHLPITHIVDISPHIEAKLQAFSFHASQNLTEPRQQLTTEKNHYELYQAVLVNETSQKWLRNHWLFQPMPKDFCATC